MISLPQTLELAVKHHQAGNLQQAELLYRQILQVDPLHVDALHLFGLIALQAGQCDVAVDCMQKAIRLRPQFPAAHNNLGNALRTQGKFAEATASYRQALRLQPNYAEAHNNLGTALKDQGMLEEAVASYRQALRLKPDYASAHNNLGSTLRDLGKLEDAIACCRQALRLKPDYAEAYNNLGNALYDQGQLEQAIASYRQAVRLKPDDVEMHDNLGNALKEQGKLEDAIACYRQALRLKPDHADSHHNLGITLTEMGRFDEAAACVQEALRLQPKHAAALWHLVRLRGGKLSDAERVLIENRLADPDLHGADRAHLLFALAQACDARGEYESAAAKLRQAQTLALEVRRRQGMEYDVDSDVRFVDNLMAAFTPAFFERVRGFGLETERPVFIVGLPRSGTTLTEQILAAHSQVFGAGELNLGRADFQALGKEPTEQSSFAALPGLERETVRLLGQRHLDQLGKLNGTAARVVDKMPNNFLFLGLLAALFPRAKFIRCRRDLRDVAVSYWMTDFSFFLTKDPDHIAVLFGAYRRLIEHWRAVLPVPVLEVDYEETVADLPRAARRLVQWCGLDWEPACLNFHEATRPVRTASVIQVRQPIYTRSVGRWRNYERDLGPLFDALKPLQEKSILA